MEARLIKSGCFKTQKLHWAVLCELQCVFDKNPTRFDLEAHCTTPPCVIAAVKEHIEELAGKTILEKLDSMYKERYSDCFPMDKQVTDRCVSPHWSKAGSTDFCGPCLLLPKKILWGMEEAYRTALRSWTYLPILITICVTVLHYPKGGQYCVAYMGKWLLKVK